MSTRIDLFLSVTLSSHNLSEADSREVSRLLHTIGDFERISDHAVGIAKAAKEMHDNISISQTMQTANLKLFLLLYAKCLKCL